MQSQPQKMLILEQIIDYRAVNELSPRVSTLFKGLIRQKIYASLKKVR